MMLRHHSLEYSMNQYFDSQVVLNKEEIDLMNNESPSKQWYMPDF